MKKLILLSTIFVLALAGSAVAQQERKVEKVEWQKQVRAADSTLAVLKAKKAECENEGRAIQSKIDAAKANQVKLEKEIYELVNATAETKAAYSRELEAIENRLKQIAALSNDDIFKNRAELDKIEADLNNLRMNKLSLLPENDRRIQAAVSQIDKLRKVQPTSKTYTVGTWAKDRDCLWNIAKKKTIFDNPFKWPSIYNANKDKIKDPNLIYKGQVLTIPAN